VADAYLFNNYQTLLYTQYVDLATQRALVAQPGCVYSMRSTDPDLFNVPPSDGRWSPVASAKKAQSKAVKSVPEKLALTEKGE
jgi:hypothetical protein